MILLYFIVLVNVLKIRGNVFNIGGIIVNSLLLFELFKLFEDYCNIDMRFINLFVRESD